MFKPKKLIAGALSAALMFGMAAALPADLAGVTSSIISASALTSGDYEYEDMGDGTVGITKYNGSASTLTIPSKLGGKSVSMIGDEAFKNERSLTSVTIPEGVVSIGEYAFGFCGNITSIKFPSTVTAIRDDAFYGCESLKTLNLPKGLRSIGGLAFYNCNSLTSVTIPDTVTRIEGGAFWCCESLTSVTIPDSVTELGGLVFSECTNLKSVTLSKNITSIGGRAFEKCKSLESIVIPEGVTIIHSQAFDTCTSLKSVTIPSSVSYIIEKAFYFCTNLTNVVLPEGVRTIEKEAFAFSGMKSITIPESVTSIGDYAFDGCDSLVINGYSGSAAETYAKNNNITFKAITKGKLASATIPYSSYTYRGRGIKPTVTVKDGAGKKLTKDKDYTVSYSNNTNVGTATITIKGKGSYTGTLTKKFTVKPLDLTSSYAKVTIPYSSYTYTGSAIKPAVTVKFKDGDVIPTGQYTVSYSANKNVGTATITVKGNGKNTTGTLKKAFVVKPAKNEIKTITSTKGAFKITWNKGTAGTVGYQVQYSTDKNFSKNVHSWTTTTLSKTSENFSSVPKSGETWYVKVRSFYTKDGKSTSTRYGNYSSVKTIKIK